MKVIIIDELFDGSIFLETPRETMIQSSESPLLDSTPQA